MNATQILETLASSEHVVDGFSGLLYFPVDHMGAPILSVDALGVVRSGASMVNIPEADAVRAYRARVNIPAPFRTPLRLNSAQRSHVACLCDDAGTVSYLAELPCRAYLAQLLNCDEVTDSNSLWTMIGMDDGCNDEPASFDPEEVCRGVELWSAGINPYTGRPIASDRWARLERANLCNVDADLDG